MLPNSNLGPTVYQVVHVFVGFVQIVVALALIEDQSYVSRQSSSRQ